MRIAVYAGTFDPMTLGHLSVLEEALRLFDHVIVLVAINDQKTPLFAEEERLELARCTVAHLGDRVSVAATRGLVVDEARVRGARHLVRGVRGATDAEHETRLAQLNRGLAPEIATVFVPAREDLASVSSTDLKARIARGEDASRYAHPEVVRRLHTRLTSSEERSPA